VGSLAISGSGRYAAFRSLADHLVAGDANGADDLFRVDLLTGSRDVVSTAPWGQGEGETAFGASFSGDGSVVAFGTEAGNLALGDINLRRDVLARTYEVAIPGDLDGDGIVGAADLAILLGSWGAAGGAADLDGDGSVGASDLALLLGAWSIAP
jgi:hypothetical protein